jgi:hypothetical protein
MDVDHVDRLFPKQLGDMATCAWVDWQFERHPCGHPINSEPIHIVST